MTVMSLSLADQDFQDKYGPAVTTTSSGPAVTTTSTTTPNTTAPISYEAPPQWWEGNTWTSRVKDYQRESLAEMYLASTYFALMTITTIGYGDIVPVCDSLRCDCLHAYYT